MKQKIVIKVTLDCEKCRRKALGIAAVAEGVSSVSLEGGEKDQLVVIGDGFDSVCLAKRLRKKFRRAGILSVQEVKEEKENKDKRHGVPQYPPCPITSCHVVYDSYPNGFCSILSDTIPCSRIEINYITSSLPSKI